MTFREILRLPALNLAAHKLAYALAFLAILQATVWPTDLANYRTDGMPTSDNIVVHWVEDYGRQATTVAAIAVPLILRDWTGLKQLLAVTVAGLLATHGPKRLLNDVEVMGTRLGERPYGTESRHNMPSGHSSLAAATSWFLARRFGWRWLWLGIPVIALTVWARYMLGAHTISALIAGTLIGIVIASLFVTRRTSAGVR